MSMLLFITFIRIIIVSDGVSTILSMLLGMWVSCVLLLNVLTEDGASPAL